MNSKLLYKQHIINYFCKIYEIDKQQLLTNELYYFRYICYKYNDFMKYIELPPIASKSYNEAVLIEFRSFPHYLKDHDIHAHSHKYIFIYTQHKNLKIMRKKSE